MVGMDLNMCPVAVDFDDFEESFIDLTQPTSTVPVVSRKKPVLRDWSMREMKVLIAAKQFEHESVDFGGSMQVKMTSKKSKWEAIASFMFREGVCNPVRDSDACKKKWSHIYRDFKKVFDYEKLIPSGHKSYWELSTAERKEKKVPLNFSEELYRECEEWLPSRQEVNPTGVGVVIADSSRSFPQTTGIARYFLSFLSLSFHIKGFTITFSSFVVLTTFRFICHVLADGIESTVHHTETDQPQVHTDLPSKVLFTFSTQVE